VDSSGIGGGIKSIDQVGKGGTGGPANDTNLAAVHRQKESSIGFHLGGIAGKAGLPRYQRHKRRCCPCRFPLIIGHIVRREKTYQCGNTPTLRLMVIVYHLTVVLVGLTPGGISRYAS
jgi:hypothetical protein